MLCALAAWILDEPARDNTAENEAITGIVLCNALLEGVPGIGSLVPGIIDLYLKHM